MGPLSSGRSSSVGLVTGFLRNSSGTGGGFGGVVRGIGVYTISNGQVRFIPAIDTTALVAMGVLLTGLVLRARSRRQR